MTKTVKIIIATVAIAVIVGAVLGGVFGARAVNKNRAEANARRLVH